MATLNVFELTNQEFKKYEESNSSKKTVSESVKRTKTSKRKPFAIPASKIKVESLKRFLEDEGEDELDVTADYTPEDDVVLVIDPEMDEVPEDVEEAEDAAEDLIGNHVCKCAICGANYVTDEELSEDMEVLDDTCPVCGETGDQIVVGVITPTEELSDDDKEDVDDVEVEETEDEEDVQVDDETFEEEDTDDFEESVRRSRNRTMRRKAESVRRTPLQRAKKTSNSLEFDDVTLNRMLTTFAKENYSNVKFVKVTKGSVNRSRLTLEGVVITTKGSKRGIKFVCENFKKSPRMSLRFKEFGPFTESVENEKPTFVVECVAKAGVIKPVSLRYSYITKNANMKESNRTYSVTGKVLSESVRRRK